MPTHTLITGAELWHMPDTGKRLELVKDALNILRGQVDGGETGVQVWACTMARWEVG